MNYNFNFGLYIFRRFPTFYLKVINLYTNEVVFGNKDSLINLKGNVVIVEDVPEYLKIVEYNIPNGVKFKSIKQYPGFLMNFDGINTQEEYLKSRFGRTSRYKLRRSKKRLESCFDIKYRMYFGEISKDNYNFIFEELYRLLEIRLLEKNIINEGVIGTKEEYKKFVYQMILNKEASLYVIYNSNFPIDICLNFHIKNTIFQLYRTYDIAYSKFNTGYVNLMNQIEWCVNNEIKMLSFGKGYFYWKKRWCNTEYNYDYHIFYDSKSIKSIIKTWLYYYQKRLKQFLREKKVIDKYHQLWNKKSQLKEPNKITHTTLDFNSDVNGIKRIDFTSDKYSFLRRNVYDFLFEFSENEKDVTLFKIPVATDSYLIVGKQNKQLIEISN